MWRLVMDVVNDLIGRSSRHRGRDRIDPVLQAAAEKRWSTRDQKGENSTSSRAR